MAAIYQWFQRDVQVLTTTLYPLEVVDAVQFSFNLVSGSLQPVPQDSIYVSGNVIAASLNQILLSYGTPEDNLDISANVIYAHLNQILLSYGTPEDELDVSWALIEVLLISLLVTVDTPDEKLQLDFDVNTSGWFMTPV